MRFSCFFCAIILSIPGLANLLDSDSGIHGPKYSKILSSLTELHEENVDLTRLEDYGETVQGRTLRMLVLKKEVSILGPRPAVFFSGAIHGNEYTAIADHLPKLIIQRTRTVSRFTEFVNRGGVVLMVPILNPDGYENRSRYNANGSDLNRDWDVPTAQYKGFKQNETKFLAEKIQKLVTEFNLDLKITIDYHCCAGALLHPWSHSNQSLPESSLSEHQKIGEMGDKHLNLEVGATGQVLGYYPMGTSKDYYYTQYGARAFSYEGRYSIEKDKLSKHLLWWEDMVDWIGRGEPLDSLLATAKIFPLLTSTID